MQDSSGNRYHAEVFGKPRFTGNFMDLNQDQREYLELSNPLDGELEDLRHFSFLGWYRFKTVRRPE